MGSDDAAAALKRIYEGPVSKVMHAGDLWYLQGAPPKPCVFAGMRACCVLVAYCVLSLSMQPRLNFCCALNHGGAGSVTTV